MYNPNNAGFDKEVLARMKHGVDSLDVNDYILKTVTFKRNFINKTLNVSNITPFSVQLNNRIEINGFRDLDEQMQIHAFQEVIKANNWSETDEIATTVNESVITYSSGKLSHTKM